MYIELQPIFDKYNIHPKGVVQVGCHWCEEHEEFISLGIERFAYIEPCREAFDVIRKKLFNITIMPDMTDMVNKYGGISNGRDFDYVIQMDGRICAYNVACGSIEQDNVPMYVSHENQGQSNSLLKPELHLLQHPEVVFNDAEVVKVMPLDRIVQINTYDMLVMDVQGYEGEVLFGATETLKSIKIIYTEVNRGQTYRDNKEIDWMDGFLGSLGFARVETFWPSENLTWGDAVYVKVNYKINE